MPARIPDSAHLDRHLSVDFESLGDVELVDAARQSTPGALAALHDRVRPAIERTLLRLLGIHDADFDDMLQNTLIELVTSLGRYRGAGPIAAFASVLAARVVYRELRARQSSRRMLAADPVDEVSVASSEDPEAESATRELIARIRRHLDHLDADKAWTYLLHDVWGYELTEIAEITNVTVAAAQSRLVRGRKLLEARLASDPELAARLREGKS